LQLLFKSQFYAFDSFLKSSLIVFWGNCQAGEVRVKITHTALCHTDFYTLSGKVSSFLLIFFNMNLFTASMLFTNNAFD
jgi:hypothetical protein